MSDEQNLVYLTKVVGVEQDEAERILADDDLWLIEPSLRFASGEEDDVQVWQDAVHKLKTLAVIGYNDDFYNNPAVTMALADAEVRAREALRRARQRAREAAS